jgi:predicted enzyme related to lactoylglutathione lyase
MTDDTPGHIRWVDLTVPDAPKLREFYEAVVGWESAPVNLGTHEDWCMTPPGEIDPVAGICHARGINSALPPVWLIYITVASLADSIAECKSRGGQVIYGPKNFGTDGQWCVIRDPAGACAALFEPRAAA